MAALKASPYVRNDIPIIGYVLDVGTGQLREVKSGPYTHDSKECVLSASSILRTGQNEAARRQVLSELEDFGPFWS